MEVRIYRSVEDMSKGKHFYCVRVDNPDTFDYYKTRSVFQTIYGVNIVYVVISL